MPQPHPAGADRHTLDADITAAYRDLNVARARFHLNPSGEAVTECERAEAHLNELLERRYALTHPQGAAPLAGAS